LQESCTACSLFSNWGNKALQCMHEQDVQSMAAHMCMSKNCSQASRPCRHSVSCASRFRCKLQAAAVVCCAGAGAACCSWAAWAQCAAAGVPVQQAFSGIPGPAGEI
jgi:hypothetical protein